MLVPCIQCDAHLVNARIQLEGTIRGETYLVEMDGLSCPACDYRTIEGTAMPEFMRLLADRYRTNHGLLTSDQIRTRRAILGMSQEGFAKFLGVGIASVKRWEMGKIQDKRSNDLILEKTGAAIRANQSKTSHAGFTMIVSGKTYAVQSIGTVMAFAKPNTEASCKNPEERLLNAIKKLGMRRTATTSCSDIITDDLIFPKTITELIERSRKERHHRGRQPQAN